MPRGPMSPLQAALYAGVLAGLVSGLAYTALFPVIPWLIWGDSPHQGITGALVMVALIWWGGPHGCICTTSGP